MKDDILTHPSVEWTAVSAAVSRSSQSVRPAGAVAPVLSQPPALAEHVNNNSNNNYNTRFAKPMTVSLQNPC